MHHGVTLNFGCAKVCSPAIFKTSFSYNKDIWIAATDYYIHFYIILFFFSIDSYSPINKIYSFIIISPDESRGYIGFRSVAPPPPPPP